METTTQASEFIAARTAVNRMIDIHTIQKDLGFLIIEKSHIFGDNQLVGKNHHEEETQCT